LLEYRVDGRRFERSNSKRERLAASYHGETDRTALLASRNRGAEISIAATASGRGSTTPTRALPGSRQRRTRSLSSQHMPAPPMMPGISGPPGGAGDGGLGRDPVMQRQRQPVSDPSRQGPRQRHNPMFHSPQGPAAPSTKSPSGPSKSPGGRPPSHGPGGHSPGAGSGAPAMSTMSHKEAMAFLPWLMQTLV
jgi:hypothetical protein